MAMVNRIQEQVKEIALKLEELNLVDIIENSIKMVNPYFTQGNVRIIRNYMPETCIPILLDEVHTKECFINVLKNAIEAIGDRESGVLHVGIFKEKKHVIVSIRDNGSGIKKENLGKVLQPFFSTKNRKDNFGLGLSYCYSVMQKHGGTIDIQSEINIGTEILLYFPFRQSNDLSLPEMGGNDDKSRAS